ncbi:DinB family protein [Reichenbachiella sp.]|uniref:DinB family protein n=1 Tax=Reichenbachiella sp. TaxID=2184521 RepID=UPI003297EE04
MKDAVNFVVFFLFLYSCNSPYEKETVEVRWWTNTDKQLIISELKRTTAELKKEIDGLTDAQWNFKEDDTRWSIAEIVEHLEMQNQLHYREISVTVNGPRMLELRQITRGKDDYFSKYATDATKGIAQWYLEPLGRFCSQQEGKKAFFRARGELTKFVEQTDIDLRKQFTYRTSVDGKSIEDLKIGQVRDLHQLLLTGIAHTDRHLTQIMVIKKDTNYPN